MKRTITMLLLLVTCRLQAQELFVYSEPASNMPAKSMGLRLSNYLNRADSSGTYTYHAMPEVMLGISKKIMVHLMAMTSNRDPNQGLAYEGFNFYAKYRFFSNDDVQQHFRLAAYMRLSSNKARVHMQEINLQAHNSGREWGLIATQLLHRTAVSGTISWQKAWRNGNHKFPYPGRDQALGWSFSAGQLLLPVNYNAYSQTNLNLMVELLGQTNLGGGGHYVDIAPSIQFIFNSQTRVDLGMRRQLSSSLQRNFTQGFLLKLEHTIFNVMK